MQRGWEHSCRRQRWCRLSKPDWARTMHAARFSRLNRAQRKQKDPIAIHRVDATAVSAPKRRQCRKARTSTVLAVSGSSPARISRAPSGSPVLAAASLSASCRRYDKPIVLKLAPTRASSSRTFSSSRTAAIFPLSRRDRAKRKAPPGAGRVIKSSAGGREPALQTVREVAWFPHLIRGAYPEAPQVLVAPDKGGSRLP
jgi:hypothetical protein